MSTILLKFASPLQSWGTNSHFNIRHTDLHPSKSALIGLVAAALGYRRNEDEKIQRLNNLDFAVRVDQIGNITKDFQVARHDYIEKAVYLTDRYYLEDSIFLVAIGSEDESLMDEIAYALKHPYFQLFLGRRSVPINADFYLEQNEKSPLENLKTYPWLGQNWYRRKNEDIKTLSIFADGDLVERDIISKEMRKDRVVSFSKEERLFNNRQEVRIDILLKDVYKKDSTEVNDNNQHDIFGNV